MTGLAGASGLTTVGTPAAVQTPGRGRTELRIQTGEKLVMIGDSITDVGRARPIGEGRADDALGRGYVMMVDALLGAVYPERMIRVINMGVSGNTTRDLKARWQTDVLELKPAWLSIMIGANDVWRQFDSPKQSERHVLLDEYERNLVELVSSTQPVVKGLVLMAPYLHRGEPPGRDARHDGSLRCCSEEGGRGNARRGVRRYPGGFRSIAEDLLSRDDQLGPGPPQSHGIRPDCPRLPERDRVRLAARPRERLTGTARQQAADFLAALVPTAVREF